jgi:endopolyphosphatase
VSDCDSPIALVNKTIEWIGKELRDEIDFVIWTGDSARHDNDEDHPRTAAQVTELNQFMVNKMFEVFGKHNGDESDRDPNNDFIIPIVPNIGNNDILPHNIMTKGPNRWTRSFLNVWRQFIPEVQKHSFEQGGWFSVDVIPNKLAVFSLNTMYFFQSNAAVDGCAAKSEPGFRQMEWLRIQLQLVRDRGMKAIMIGHVPPARTDAKTQWDETCWQKYTLWMQQYRDVVIAGMWGHMNYDHFMLQDFHDINDDTNGGRMKISQIESALREIPDDEMHAEVSSNYFTDLRKQFSQIPKPPKSLRWAAAEELMESSDDQRPMWEVEALLDEMTKGKGKGSGKSKKQKRKEKEKKYLKDIGGKFAERYSVSFASASVVPNLLPVVRVYEYNVSGLDSRQSSGPQYPSSAADYDREVESEMNELDREDNGLVDILRKKHKDQKFTIPNPPSKSSPPGPAYSPQTLTLLGYKQYLANLTHINNDFAASEYPVEAEQDLESSKWNEGKHKGKKPHEHDDEKTHKPDPKSFKFELHYDTRNDSVYNLPDLTIRSMLGLAREIGACEPKSKSLARTATDLEEEIEEVHDDDDNEDDNAEAGVQKKKKHDKKKKKKKGKKHGGKKHKKCRKNETWHTFIRRAFVETLDPEDIGGEFGN